MVNEMKNGQENESHLSMLLINERDAIDAKNRALSKCEMLLKQCSEQNEEMNRKNATLAEDVSKSHFEWTYRVFKTMLDVMMFYN